MRGLCHVLWLIPALSPALSHSDSADLHCWLFPVQRCRSDPEWLAGTPRVLLGQPAADRCWEEAREAWINCRNAGLEAVDFALAPNVSLEKALAMCEVKGPEICLFEKSFSSPINISFNIISYQLNVQNYSSSHAVFTAQEASWWCSNSRLPLAGIHRHFPQRRDELNLEMAQVKFSKNSKIWNVMIPMCSMYGIFTNICPKCR